MREIYHIMKQVYQQQQSSLRGGYRLALRQLRRAYPRGPVLDAMRTLIRTIDANAPLDPAVELLRERLAFLFEDMTPTLRMVAQSVQDQGALAAYPAATVDYVGRQPFLAILANFGRYHADRVANAVLQARFDGRNLLMATQRLQAQLAQSSAYPLADAIRLARTTQLYSYRAALIERYAHAGHAHWIWASGLDTRTCPACWAMHGRLFAVDVVGPQDHHNGRCAPVAMRREWDAADILTGPEIFRGLPTDQQRAILGGAFADWKAGRLHFADIAQPYHNPLFGVMYRADLNAARQPDAVYGWRRHAVSR